MRREAPAVVVRSAAAVEAAGAAEAAAAEIATAAVAEEATAPGDAWRRHMSARSDSSAVEPPLWPRRFGTKTAERGEQRVRGFSSAGRRRRLKLRSARATEPTTPPDTLGGPVRRRAKPGVARGKPQRWRASPRHAFRGEFTGRGRVHSGLSAIRIATQSSARVLRTLPPPQTSRRHYAARGASQGASPPACGSRLVATPATSGHPTMRLGRCSRL